MPITTDSPASQLQGRVLDGGWEVIQLIEPEPEATGGNFSHGYIVQSSDGRQAYLKAMDYSAALISSDPARELQALTQAYNFERDICRRCANKRLDRVVTALAEGKCQLDPSNPLTVVQYLIFELASGDVRHHLDAAETFDTAWALRALHHVANGLRQLHGQMIAHQDLKPSNVLVFSEQRYSKIADLGRASSTELSSPFDHLHIAGDRSYAPPELLYGYAHPDWKPRRLGCDLYHLGSMVTFFFGRANMTALLFSFLDDAYHWRTWAGTYGDVLPYVRDAFGKAVACFEKDVPEPLRQDLTETVRQLCDPDLSLRGHPDNVRTGISQYDLQRYVSVFDRLARHAELRLRG